MTLKATPTRSQGVARFAKESNSSHGEENMDVKVRVSIKREASPSARLRWQGGGGPCSLIASLRSLRERSESGLIRFLGES